MDNELIKRLEEEEKEAEKLLYGDDAEGAEDGTEQGEEPDSELDPTEETEAEEPAEKKERTSWKKRFTSYKASTDQTIHQLRQEMAAISARYGELEKQYKGAVDKAQELQMEAKKNVDPFDGVITKEEEELLGPEAVAVLRKFASKMADNTHENPEVASVKAELDELKKERAEQIAKENANSQKANLNEFKERLIKAVPDFDKVDTDEKFGEYLEDIDEASGLPRLDLYKTAIQGRDVLGVARFYNDFQATRPKTRKERLEEEITPEGRGAENVDLNDMDRKPSKRYHITEYETFMDNITKGTYRGREKEAKKIEMLFDKAFLDDRVDGI